MPSSPKTGTNLRHPRPPQSLKYDVEVKFGEGGGEEGGLHDVGFRAFLKRTCPLNSLALLRCQQVRQTPLRATLQPPQLIENHTINTSIIVYVTIIAHYFIFLHSKQSWNQSRSCGLLNPEGKLWIINLWRRYSSRDVSWGTRPTENQPCSRVPRFP